MSPIQRPSNLALHLLRHSEPPHHEASFQKNDHQCLDIDNTANSNSMEAFKMTQWALGDKEFEECLSLLQCPGIQTGTSVIPLFRFSLVPTTKVIYGWLSGQCELRPPHTGNCPPVLKPVALYPFCTRSGRTYISTTSPSCRQTCSATGSLDTSAIIPNSEIQGVLFSHDRQISVVVHACLRSPMCCLTSVPTHCLSAPQPLRIGMRAPPSHKSSQVWIPNGYRAVEGTRMQFRARWSISSPQSIFKRQSV